MRRLLFLSSFSSPPPLLIDWRIMVSSLASLGGKPRQNCYSIYIVASTYIIFCSVCPPSTTMWKKSEGFSIIAHQPYYLPSYLLLLFYLIMGPPWDKLKKSCALRSRAKQLKIQEKIEPFKKNQKTRLLSMSMWKILLKKGCSVYFDLVPFNSGTMCESMSPWNAVQCVATIIWFADDASSYAKPATQPKHDSIFN